MNRIYKENKKKRKPPFIKKILIYFILATIIVLGVKFYKNNNGIRGVISIFLGKNMETLENLDTIYVLIMGTSNDLEKELTDTIILCGYNPKQQKASMISIPRDTFIGENEKNAKGSDKINTLYSKSPQKIMEKISEITTIDVKYYAVIDTKLLTTTVDIIGEIDFKVPIDMDYDDETQNLHIHLKKGLQKIDGKKAEQLLRYRHSNPNENGTMTTYPSEYGSDDYGRMRTQREFIIEIVKQTLQLKNITKINSLIKNVFSNMDTNLNLDILKLYAPYAIEFDITNIESLQLPGTSEKINNLWFFVHNEEETLKIINEMTNKLNGIKEENKLT